MIKVECPIEELSSFGGNITGQSWGCVFTNLELALLKKGWGDVLGTLPEAG